MRLLFCSDNGEYGLTKDLVGDDPIPPYAILSHTWNEGQEVTFEDLMHGTGKSKTGYNKIQFCGQQAKLHGLQYFWVDTCCIDKSNKAEEQKAINLMFRFYRSATRCYVYLSDVSITQRKASDRSTWESAFRASRWFTRGWTLQELLAPRLVEFFSKEGKRLGDNCSLKQQIHEVTGVPKSALQGTRLSQFSDKVRFSWIQYRQTKVEEDKAYSLLGIFDVEMPLRYGEGLTSAFKRLEEEIYKLNKCLQDLRSTDPRDDKKRIEDTKGGLLKDSYRWILENSDFRRWRDNEQSRLLWIKGDPGKGKTMLLCGIINELNKSMPKTEQLSYFFCQATDSRINNATAVLRGLMYLLVNQQPSVISHIRKKHDHAGKTLFEDTNAWVALSEIITDILRDPSLNSTYLIVDGLDECATGLPKLLDFIVQTSCVSARVKWIVSSRNWPDIEERIERAGPKVKLSLELNAVSVSTAVQFYIRYRVAQLALHKSYNKKEENAVLAYLTSNANDTFLWVALVCQNLSDIPRWKVLAKLEAFPPGLDAFYNRMMQHISSSDDADLCKRIIALIAIVYRPITLDELTYLCEPLKDMADDLTSVQQIVSLCGSFLTVRRSAVYFVHQSAKDFLCTKAISEIFPSGIEEVHFAVFARSLEVMAKTLRRDMYNLRELGYPASKVEPPDPDPLAASRYSCIYWIDHLCDWNLNSSIDRKGDLQDRGAVDGFLRNKYLYWLEALSLCRSTSEGVVAMAKLEALIQERADASALIELVRDARRFIMYHKWAIENSPLQTYASALLFSPVGSIIRGLFKEEEPKWITIKPAAGDKWSACLLTLEGEGSWAVHSVAFSHDSARLVSASYDTTDEASSGECHNTVKIWDASSGECLQTLGGHGSWVNSVAFSHDSARLASASRDKTIKIWDVSSGECLQMLEGHSNSVNSVAFSLDSAWLASASAHDETIKIWDVSSGECLQMLEGHSNSVKSVAFAHDSARLASGSYDTTVKIWDASSGKCLQTLEGHSDWVISVAFSHNSAQLASASGDNTVKIWDVSSGECLQTLKGHSSLVHSVAFAHDSARLASGSYDTTVKIWDASSGKCLQTLKGHSDLVYSVAFSHDSVLLASGSHDKTVKIWDASSGECPQTLEGHSGMAAFPHDSSPGECHGGHVYSVAFSHDSARLASASLDKTIKIWDASRGECLQTLEGHSRFVWSVAFSYDSARLASASKDKTVKIWDVSSGECLQTLRGHSDWVCSVAFFNGSARLVSGSHDKTVKIWDASSGECLQTLEGHGNWVDLVTFSYDITRLASASAWELVDCIVNIWDASSGQRLQTLKGHSGSIKSVAFSYDSARLASGSTDKTVKIWDVSSGECLRTIKGHSDLVYSVAFSHNLARLASGSSDKTVKIWDVSSGECLQTLSIGKTLYSISFNITDSYLHTEIGTIDVSALSGLITLPTISESQNPQYRGLALSSDGVWITYDSENLVWLPSEYRPFRSAALENMIGIGVETGRVWICKVIS